MKLLEPDANAAPQLRVEAGCSETDLRIVIAGVTWRGNRDRAAAQRIDVTVFKDGFERGLFATVPAERGGKFEPGPGLVRMERGAGRPFELLAVPRQGDSKDAISMEIRSLEPGVLYRWRVVTRTEKGLVPSPVVNVQAPVCIGD